MKYRLMVACLCLSVAFSGHADTRVNTSGAVATSEEKGWFWQYWARLQAQNAENKKPTADASQAPQQKTDPCEKKETWSAQCGWQDPKGDYQFLVKMREALHQQAVMYPNDADKVKQYQLFNTWSVQQAMTMMRMWEWNRLQDQDLNPALTNPVAGFALRAINGMRQEQKINVSHEIAKQGGFMVWFSRSTCPACSVAAPAVKGLSIKTTIPVYEASLDGHCHQQFTQEFCASGDNILKAASRLGVRYVPDLWLFLPSAGTWIRVSSGIEAQSTVLSRIELFFTGVINAVSKGLKAAQGQSVPVDFDLSKEQQGFNLIKKGVDK